MGSIHSSHGYVLCLNKTNIGLKLNQDQLMYGKFDCLNKTNIGLK